MTNKVQFSANKNKKKLDLHQNLTFFYLFFTFFLIIIIIINKNMLNAAILSSY